MINRLLQEKIQKLLKKFPTVAILGPRQVGKTTLSLELAETIYPKPLYLDLERPSDKAKLSDPEFFLCQHTNKLVIIDEIQCMPNLFELFRGIIDNRKRSNDSFPYYLFLGSSSRDLLNQSSESLAGRIIYTVLTGFNIIEVGEENLNKLWLRGGFPDSFLASDDDTSSVWRESFITTYLERDIPAIGPRIPTETLRRFITMLAYNQGEFLNSSKLASSLGVSSPTILRYIDLLYDLFLVRILRPYHKNFGKRLVKSPKIYVKDSGIVHNLLRINDLEQLYSHPVSGNSWEGFVIENISSIIDKNINMYFYRSAAGAEIDLILEFSEANIIAVEIKRSSMPTVSKSLMEAIDTVNPSKTYVIYPGMDNYMINSKVELISLSKFLEKLKIINSVGY